MIRDYINKRKTPMTTWQRYNTNLLHEIYRKATPTKKTIPIKLENKLYKNDFAACWELLNLSSVFWELNLFWSGSRHLLRRTTRCLCYHRRKESSGQLRARRRDGVEWRSRQAGWSRSDAAAHAHRRGQGRLTLQKLEHALWLRRVLQNTDLNSSHKKIVTNLYLKDELNIKDLTW